MNPVDILLLNMAYYRLNDDGGDNMILYSAAVTANYLF